MNKKYFIIGLILSIVLIGIGVYVGDYYFMQKTATYGNFDVPGTISWIEKMQPGLNKDYASSKIYGAFEAHPLRFVSGLFIGMFLLQFIRLKGDSIVRRMAQWSMFVIARLGVLRVGGICPVKREEFGVFPFLNCQSCEMATGGCPIGMIQASLINGRFPFLFTGVMTLFGALTGRLVCGWLCPFGLFLDTFGRILTIKKIKYKIKFKPYLRYIKFAMLLWIFTAFMWTVPLFCIYVCQAANIYGYLPYYLTTGLEGYKMMFDGSYFSYIFWFHIASAIFLILGIIVSGGRWFCKYACPLGAFYGLFNYISPIKVKHIDEKCVDCGRCVKTCPMDIDLATKKFADITDCIQCGICVKTCKVNARKWQIGFKK